MIYRRLLPGTSVLLLVATACGRSPTAIVTETVPSIFPTTVPPPTQVTATTTNTAFPPTATTLTDTPIPSTTEQPLPSSTATPTPVPIAGEHSVAPGQTLSCIGRGYGVLPKAIADASGIELTSILRVGQVLKIPLVRWTNIPPGPVCPPQFSPPFPGLPVTSPSPQPPPQPPDTETPTEPPFPVTATPTQPSPTLTPTPTSALTKADTETPTEPPFPVTATAPVGTISP